MKASTDGSFSGSEACTSWELGGNKLARREERRIEEIRVVATPHGTSLKSLARANARSKLSVSLQPAYWALAPIR